MNISDLVNGLFECIGGIFSFLNVLKLYKDKQVKGVHILTMIFFTTWGVWNIYFYPVNGLTLSFYGGISVALANVIWCWLYFYYKLKKK